jgi:histidine phosphotransfer protein HptB
VLLTAISDLTMAPASAAANGQGNGNGMKTVIETDPELAELVPGFLARKREDVAALMTAVEGLDFQALRAIGHRIKGEGTGFGFEVISDIGRALEDAGRAQDTGAAERLVRALADYLDRGRGAPRQQRPSVDRRY